MKRVRLILVVLIVLGTSIVIPLLINACIWDKVSQGRDILTALSSFITLIIALLLYNRFGVEKSVLERQNNAVISLLEAMKKLRLVLHGDAGIILFTVSRKNFDLLESQNLGGKALLFNYRYLEEMKEIRNAIENILMPPEVRETFQPLVFHMFNAVRPDQTLSNQYLIVDPVAINENETHGTFNNQQATLREYCSCWRAVINAATQWLRDHSSIRIDLNI